MTHDTWTFELDELEPLLGWIDELLPSLDRVVEPVIAATRLPRPRGSAGAAAAHHGDVRDRRRRPSASSRLCRLPDRRPRDRPRARPDDGRGRRTRRRRARTPRTTATRVDCTWTDARAARARRRCCARMWSELPTEHSFSIWYGWAPSRPLPDMAFSVEGRAYIATYAIWSDPADDERHRAWVVDHTDAAGRARQGRLPRRHRLHAPPRPLPVAGELRPPGGDPRPARPRRPLLLLPDRRRRGAQRRTRPPSAYSVCPVMAPAASEARKPTRRGDVRGNEVAGDRLPGPDLGERLRRRPGLGRGRARQSGGHAVDRDPLRSRARGPASGLRRSAPPCWPRRRAGRAPAGSTPCPRPTNTMRPKPRSAIAGVSACTATARTRR